MVIRYSTRKNKTGSSERYNWWILFKKWFSFH